MRHVEKSRRTFWRLAKTYVTALLAKCLKLYSSEGEKTRKRWLTRSTVHNWNLADIKVIISFAWFTTIGFEKWRPHDTRQTFCSSVKSNFKESRKKMKKTRNLNFLHNTLFLTLNSDTVNSFKIYRTSSLYSPTLPQDYCSTGSQNSK